MLLCEIKAPEGAAADFLLLFAVMLLGPIVMKRARIPGIIGLLLGGYAIGPHGLGWVGPGNQTVPELGQFGLLYLMFVAGLELDLNLLRAHRNAAISFGVLTFLLPFGGGVAVGLSQGWSISAALLLGSLLASHTLILYPTVREAGLGGNPAIASAVGATVLTDTLALVVLAGVAGTETGSGSTTAVLGEIGLGLAVLLVTSLVLLPRVATMALRFWGGDRAARYLVAVLSFLAMAALAETFGIEGIVGAFFAGLALNRLVPNEGPSMERIEFFGSTVFVPVFLISVGLLLDPSVMFTSETLGIAALLSLACIGGKALAALATRPLLGFTGPESGAVFVLTTPQAAATLAATLVGFDIGLFSTSVVNAVLVLILASIVVSTVAAGGFMAKIPTTDHAVATLGERVLLAVRPGGPTDSAIHLTRRLTRPDSGVAEVFVAHTDREEIVDERDIAALERRIFRGSLDGEAHRVVGAELVEAVEGAARGMEASAVVVDVDTDGQPHRWEREGRRTSVPVIFLAGTCEGAPRRVVLVGGDDAHPSAREVASRLAGGAQRVHEDAEALASVEPGDAVVIGLTGGGDIAEHPLPGPGVLVAGVFEPTEVIEAHAGAATGAADALGS